MIERPLHSERLDAPLRDLMTPGVIALPASAGQWAVFSAMRAHHVHAVLIVSHDSAEPLGWVTSRALLSRAAAELQLLAAADAIDEPAVMLPPSATAREAVEQLLNSGAGRIAVCQEHARLPEGVVADLDLVELLVRRA